jgi:hypothetical protein
MIFPRSPLRLASFLIGIAMVLFAIAVANEAYARFLLGGVEKDLAWGPALFRVLLVLHGGFLIVLSFLPNPIGSVGEDEVSEANRPERRTPRSAILALVGLSFIALVLRLWNLNSDLWIDEVLTVLDFVRKPL